MNLDDAIIIAVQAHRGQVDQQKKPYIRHCLRVMEACAPEPESMILGVLHDVVEDTDAALLGPTDFTWSEWQALLLLTRRPDEAYEDYITRLCDARHPYGALARQVKRADLADNLGRITGLKEPKRSLLHARYSAAIEALDAVKRRLG